MAKAKKKGTVAWFKEKVVDAFMNSYRGLPCEVCGTTYGTCGHHYVGKGYCPRHIVTPENIIVLCIPHHGPYGKKMNPHSGCPSLYHEFEAWVKVHKPDLFEWGKAHENDTSLTMGKIPWKELYEAL